MTTVRVTQQSHAILKRLADRLDITMAEALDLVTDRWQREEFLEAVNEAYASLRKTEQAWDEMKGESDLWDSTLSDGLDDFEADIKT